jgi:hypothetical protein
MPNFVELQLGEVQPGSGNKKPGYYRYRYRLVSDGRLPKRARCEHGTLRYWVLLGLFLGHAKPTKPPTLGSPTTLHTFDT